MQRLLWDSCFPFINCHGSRFYMFSCWGTVQRASSPPQVIQQLYLDNAQMTACSLLSCSEGIHSFVLAGSRSSRSLKTCQTIIWDKQTNTNVEIGSSSNLMKQTYNSRLTGISTFQRMSLVKWLEVTHQRHPCLWPAGAVVMIEDCKGGSCAAEGL